MITNEGRDYLMDNGFVGPFYIGLYIAARQVHPGDTLSTFLADAVECVATPARIEMVATRSQGVFSNLMSPAVFSFTASGTAIGSFVATALTGGTLISAEQFPTIKHYNVGDSINVVSSIPVIPV